MKHRQSKPFKIKLQYRLGRGGHLAAERKTQESKSAAVYTQNLQKYGTANLKDSLDQT